jgi:hypothetical protein
MDDSMLADIRDSDAMWRGRAGRRVAVGALTVLLTLGLTGALGVHTSEVTASEGGYQVTVEYPRVARAGLDIRWRVSVRHPGGFDQPVTIATTADYFDIMETQGFLPGPQDETSTGRSVYQTYAPPAGELFQVTYDGYIQPASQLGRRATTMLVVDGRQLARVDYRSWLLP